MEKAEKERIEVKIWEDFLTKIRMEKVSFEEFADTMHMLNLLSDEEDENDWDDEDDDWDEDEEDDD